MAFLASASQKTVLKLQHNFLQFRALQMTNQIRIIKNEMDMYQQANAGSGEDYTSDPQYLYYEQMDEYYSTLKDSIDQEAQLVQQEITALENTVKQGIQQSCKLNLAGG